MYILYDFYEKIKKAIIIIIIIIWERKCLIIE